MAIGRLRGIPGTSLHGYIAKLFAHTALKSQSISPMTPSQIFESIFYPMDSIRYFEFDAIWRGIDKQRHPGRYLDLSSPRLFTALAMAKRKIRQAFVVNPDYRDLEVTQRVYRFLGLDKRCQFFNQRIDQLSFPGDYFDTIVSISVLEHIPADEDIQAITRMWHLLKNKGTLFLSVPCACDAMEEFINYNEYGLLEPSADQFVFGQRFYSEQLLKERIFDFIGAPRAYRIMGEKKYGLFFRNRLQKHLGPGYPFWKEPVFTGNCFRHFDRLSDLPGLGVMTMEFSK